MDGSEHKSKYLGAGADAIQYRMEQYGFSEDVIPSISTIKRIIKKHGMKINKRERYKRVKSKKRYTILNSIRINEMQQVDFVGPRFVKGYGAISSLNLIDVVNNQVYIDQFDAKSTDNVMTFLIKYWSNNPIPKYLQVDNVMHFIGNFTHPRRFSRFIRLCLLGGFISEYLWATICMESQKMMVYYRAQDLDITMRIKEFDYEINEEIKQIKRDLYKI